MIFWHTNILYIVYLICYFFLSLHGNIFMQSTRFLSSSTLLDLRFFRIVGDWEALSPSQRHLFHLVTPSPWPFFSAVSAFFLTFGAVLYFHSVFVGGVLLFFGFLLLLSVMAVWWRDVLREAVWLGYHNSKVRDGIAMGFVLFIVSEVMFFFSWFWAFFHSGFSPTVELGVLWPPYGFDASTCINPLSVPLINTVVLAMSGVSVTWSHKCLTTNDLAGALLGLIVTVALGLYFTGLQLHEYIEAPFNISDSVFGSCFFMITGFHGFHVICGTIFLIVCIFRVYEEHVSKARHNGVLFAIWYWHFVDAVWFFVYAFLYWWSSVGF